LAIVRLEISINDKFIKSTVEAITKVVKKEGIRDAEIFLFCPLKSVSAYGQVKPIKG
jgi:nitrogen regulatory protein PII